jgi:hypothetical protein
MKVTELLERLEELSRPNMEAEIVFADTKREIANLQVVTKAGKPIVQIVARN